MKGLILYTESSNRVGGQELQAMMQLDTFRKMGFSVLLACREGSEVEKYAREKNIPVHLVSFRNSYHIPSLLNMRRLILTCHPLFIVCHSGHDSNITAMALKTLWHKPPLIRQKTYLAGKIKPFSTNCLVDAVIVPSAGMKRTMVGGGCRNQQITVVSPGFDFSTLTTQSQQPIPASIQRWLMADTSPVIAQVGMLRAEKGHDTALNALAALKQSGHAFRYLIIGAGPLSAEIQKKIVHAGLEDNVMMAGAVFPVSALYPYIDLLLMPSRNEAFGMALVEAMYFSVPVMASDVGGIPDVVRHRENGVLLPVDDAEAWQKAIADFLHQPAAYQSLAQRAAIDVVQRYSMTSCVAKIISVANVHADTLYEPSNFPL